MVFRVEAAVGNADGVFDAADNFGQGSGEEAATTGAPDEVGQAVARYLAPLTPADCETMRYGTPEFFVQLVIRPVTSP